MKSGITPKSIALLFPAVLVLYLGIFYGIEHLRQRGGPWEVDFEADAQGTPAIVVSQPRLGLRNVRLTFQGETVGHCGGHVSFNRVQQPVPFGAVIYEDLTFLPGVVTFNLFGHEVELLPRVLIVNKKEVSWWSCAAMDLWPTNKPSEPPRPPRARN
jgi:hypothetical protein